MILAKSQMLKWVDCEKTGGGGRLRKRVKNG
jgi:hypothetical protein